MNWLREPNAEPIPGYRLVEPLGTGGFGEVWKCIAPGEIFKAIKFVYGNLNSLDGDAVRAEQEHKALQRIKEVRHPFVISTERIDILGGELMIVMELADKNLHELFVEFTSAGQPGIPRDLLLGYMRDAADGLDHLIEKHNLQHLDIKPRNLFLIADRVKVADFGLVKNLERQSSSGLMGGVTPVYAAPETFTGKVSKHSDQYSLAIVYMELLTGTKPFSGRNIRQLALQHMTEPPDLSALPEADRPIVAKALSKDPADRFPNCLAFVRALYTGHVETTVPPRPASLASLAELDLDAIPSPVRGHSPAVAPLRPVETESEEDLGRLSVTATQIDAGVLRPTLLIGVGGFGRRALLELRCRLLDSVGDLSQVPMFRFLYVDSDPDAVRKATLGTAEVALSLDDVFPLPLQPVGNYRRRMLDHLSEWLPREKLYAIPRSLQPQGSRALGRLAFTDSYLRLQGRLKRELQIITHPEAMAQSVSQTGLGLGETAPRVFVIAAAGGGSSGLLADLGYALKHQFAQQNLSQTSLTALLFCGAPSDPATPKAELANVYATLTELNHFADSAVSFAAQYGPEGPKLNSPQAPYHNVYLLQLDQRTPEAAHDCAAHLAAYLAADLTTPLGRRLDKSRQTAPRDGSLFRGFGTYSVWFPRGLLLRVAARQACQRLIAEWQASGTTHPADADAAAAAATADPALRWEVLLPHLEQAARTPAEGTPTEAVTRFLASVEEQIDQAGNDPAAWARHISEQLRDLLGIRTTTSSESLWRRSRVNRAFGQAVEALAVQWDNRLMQAGWVLMERPGRRIAAAEAVVDRLIQACLQAVAAYRARTDAQSDRTRDAWAQLQAAQTACAAGASGFSLFGNRGQRLARGLVEQLAYYARHRLAEEQLEAGTQLFQKLQGRLEERQRDLAFCRQRLRQLQPVLSGNEAEGNPSSDWSPLPIPATDPLHQALQGSATLQVVLPFGEQSMEEAAEHFLGVLRPEHWVRLDEVLQALVLAPLGGLHEVCQKSGDLVRQLAGPLLEQAAAYLSELLPITDVAQVEFSLGTAQRADLGERVKGFFDRAVPLVPGKGKQESFLLLPASEAGTRLGETAHAALPELQLVPSPVLTEMLVCREQLALTPTDLSPLLTACRAAYRETAPVPATSPHARFDIPEWGPLEP